MQILESLLVRMLIRPQLKFVWMFCRDIIVGGGFGPSDFIG